MKYLWQHYPHLSIIAWSIWAAAGGGLEWIGLRRKGRFIPLTWYIRDSIPRWLIFMILGWLLYHFGVQTNQFQPSH